MRMNQSGNVQRAGDTIVSEVLQNVLIRLGNDFYSLSGKKMIKEENDQKIGEK